MKLCNECFDAATLRAKELDAACEAVIEELQHCKPLPEGAINWGDLHCVEAFVRIGSVRGMSGEVLIEEAAPDNYDFQVAVNEGLKARGFDNVEVRTEW